MKVRDYVIFLGVLDDSHQFSDLNPMTKVQIVKYTFYSKYPYNILHNGKEYLTLGKELMPISEFRKLKLDRILKSKFNI